MNDHYFRPEWRSLLTAVAMAADADDASRLAAADFLHAWGDRLRAEYIRACCATADQTVGGHLPPHTGPFAPLSGWVPNGACLYYWHRGFITGVHGPLDTVRDALPDLILREPLYQSPAGPVVVSVSDRAPLQTDDGGHWTWGCESGDGEQIDQTISEFDHHGPLLPPHLFDLLPWPPLFDTAEAATAALSAALLAEAHELVHVV